MYLVCVYWGNIVWKGDWRSWLGAADTCVSCCWVARMAGVNGGIPVCAYCTSWRSISFLHKFVLLALCSWSITLWSTKVLALMCIEQAVRCCETGCRYMYVYIFHLYYIFSCIGGLHCKISIALVTGHYTLVAGHVPYACMLSTHSLYHLYITGRFHYWGIGHYCKIWDLQLELVES